MIHEFGAAHPDFPFTIIEESQKGTGCAVNTGFLAAIEQGFGIIARTDADTLPLPSWTQAILNNFTKNPFLQLLGGNRVPRKDDGFYKKRDALLWPLGVSAGRCLRCGDKETGLITGNNMATRRAAYLATGGFPKTSIAETDEDREYERRIGAEFGEKSVVLDPSMVVATSMRRLREYGYLGLARYRVSPASRVDQGNIDIRQPVPVH